MRPSDYSDVSLHSKHDDKGQAMRLAEHELVLSFNNDVGAAAFSDYWREFGEAHYQAWCVDNLHELSESYR